jgi:hypothetical protein
MTLLMYVDISFHEFHKSDEIATNIFRYFKQSK